MNLVHLLYECRASCCIPDTRGGWLAHYLHHLGLGRRMQFGQSLG
jgi:hypothetical protein